MAHFVVVVESVDEETGQAEYHTVYGLAGSAEEGYEMARQGARSSAVALTKEHAEDDFAEPLEFEVWEKESTPGIVHVGVEGNTWEIHTVTLVQDSYQR